MFEEMDPNAHVSPFPWGKAIDHGFSADYLANSGL
jgi:hypothetical protein